MATTVTVSSTVTFNPPAETTSGIVTQWLPLATVAPPPYGQCWNGSFQNDYDEPFDSTPIAFDPGFAFLNATSSETAAVYCQPMQVVTWYSHRSASVRTTASSAGETLATVSSIQPIQCPSEWYTAVTSTVRNSLQVTCCPSGYTADPNNDHGLEANCGSQIPAGQVFSYLDKNNSEVTTTFSTAIGVAAVAIKGWNSIASVSATRTSGIKNSLSSSTSSSASTSASATEPETAVTSTVSSFPSTSPSSHNGSGTAAGIFAGVFGGVALISIGIYWLLRRRRQKQKALQDKPGNAGLYANVPQSPGDRSTQLTEMPTANNTPELFSEYSPRGPEIYEVE